MTSKPKRIVNSSARDDLQVALVLTPCINESGSSQPIVPNGNIVGDAGKFPSYHRRSQITEQKFEAMGDDFNFADGYCL